MMPGSLSKDRTSRATSPVPRKQRPRAQNLRARSAGRAFFASRAGPGSRQKTGMSPALGYEMLPSFRRAESESKPSSIDAYWALDSATLLKRLDATRNGLTAAQAAARLARYGKNALKERRLSWLGVLGNQL